MTEGELENLDFGDKVYRVESRIGYNFTKDTLRLIEGEIVNIDSDGYEISIIKSNGTNDKGCFCGDDIMLDYDLSKARAYQTFIGVCEQRIKRFEDMIRRAKNQYQKYLKQEQL